MNRQSRKPAVRVAAPAVARLNVWLILFWFVVALILALAVAAAFLPR